MDNRTENAYHAYNKYISRRRHVSCIHLFSLGRLKSCGMGPQILKKFYSQVSCHPGSLSHTMSEESPKMCLATLVIDCAGTLPPVMRCADLTTLWRALRWWTEQLQYQAVIQPDTMLSIVHL